MKKHLFTVVVAAAVASLSSAASAQLLDEVRERGYLQCGVTEGVSGFSIPDGNNSWVGIEVDYCRAVAAAIFDDPDAVRYTPLSAAARWDALSNGSVDILSRQTTWTMQRDTALGITFVGTLFYDGQGFMVRADSGITSVLELSGASICIEQGTTTELNAADYFAANGLDFVPQTFAAQGETVQTYEDGGCDAFSTDSSVLASERSSFADPDAHIILPEIISKEPLGPSVRSGDVQWFNIARWVYYALLNAEELGVTSKNVDEMKESDNPAVRRLLGLESDFGAFIGLDSDWAYRIVSHVGNYGEIYETNLGEATPIGIPRGINNLWNNGGIQYAPPIR